MGATETPRFELPHDLAARLDPLDAPVEVPVTLRLADAAVVALLMRAEADVELVLIERAHSMRNHAGQLAFPGGKPESGDASLIHTALREAAEEVGLPPSGTEVIGRLGPVPTPTGFVIVPYVAWAPVGWRPTVQSSEVASIITPSLATLADPSLHRVTGRGIWHGLRYELHEFRIHEPPLWGATARIVWDLLERVR